MVNEYKEEELRRETLNIEVSKCNTSTMQILTWSPGWGLIRETWSYPRRNRAQIASSLP